MKKKYITLLSTIATLTLVLVMTTLIKGKYIFKPKIKAIRDEITALEVVKENSDTIFIEMIEGNWKINTNFNIEKERIDNILDTIKKAEITTVVSSGSDEEILSKYGLTSGTVEITAYNKNKKIIRKLKVGDKAQSTFDSYGQIGGDKKIYILTSNKNIYDTFNFPISEIISKTVANVSSYNVIDVTITDSNDNKYTLKKIEATNTSTNEIANASQEYYWLNQDDKQISNNITPSLDDITKVSARYVEDTPVTNDNKYTYSVVINTNQSKIEYNVYGKSSNGFYRVVVSDYTNLSYYITETTYNRIEKVLDIIKKGEDK